MAYFKHGLVCLTILAFCFVLFACSTPGESTSSAMPQNTTDTNVVSSVSDTWQPTGDNVIGWDDPITDNPVTPQSGDSSNKTSEKTSGTSSSAVSTDTNTDASVSSVSVNTNTDTGPVTDTEEVDESTSTSEWSSIVK